MLFRTFYYYTNISPNLFFLTFCFLQPGCSFYTLLLSNESVLILKLVEMKLFTRYIGSQFRQPHGIVGRICCLIMNLMNRAMYRQVLKNIHLSSTSSLLEIGFGNGMYYVFLILLVNFYFIVF